MRHSYAPKTFDDYQNAAKEGKMAAQRMARARPRTGKIRGGGKGSLKGGDGQNPGVQFANVAGRQENSHSMLREVIADV